MSGDPDTIKQRDAKITIVPISGGIIWSLPLERGYPDVVQLLIEQGANVNVQDSAYGRTPLMWAARNMYGDLVTLLLSKGADRNILDKDEKTAVELTPDMDGGIIHLLRDGGTAEKPGDLNTPDASGRTPLMYAALAGDVDQVQSLLRLGANVNAVGDYGQTALIAGAQRSSAVVQLLLSQGAKVNAADKGGWTPLMAAARFSTAETMGYLIKAGADVNAQGKYDGKTVLMVASEVGPIDKVQLLLDHGADIKAQGKNDGETALVKATYHAQTDIAELLLKRGADANAGSLVGNTALLWASQNGFDDLARHLLEHGADPNTVTRSEKTPPLYYAAANGHTEIVKMLLAHGAKVDVRDTQGNSLLKTAAAHPDIVQLLKQAGATE